MSQNKLYANSLTSRMCCKCAVEKPIEAFTKAWRNPLGIGYSCLECNRAQRRAEYLIRGKNKPEIAKTRRYLRAYKMRNVDKVRAQGRVYDAVKGGLLIRPDRCSSCDKAGPVHGHHEDYSKPLEVMWLCVSCHRFIHRKVA